ncbi:CHASE2 domain-containing protein [Azonexus sp.]|uniref:CHASE2 domain-containing protein n=1 Tax=Azonexus sp. TaxID=1872668 RepID=UPI0039E3F41A
MQTAPPSQHTAALPLLFFAALIWLGLLAYAHPWHDLDLRLGDILMRRAIATRPPPPEIVLIDIDQASLDHPQMLELAGNWPWPRAIHGELLAFLALQQPRAIVFDLIFSEPDHFRPASDQVLEDALRQTPAYLPLVVTNGETSRLADLPPLLGIRPGRQADPEAGLALLAPKALSPEVWRTGLINFLADSDGLGRSYWLNYPHAGWSLPSLPARVAADLGLPVPAQERLPLHFYGQPFSHLSYASLFLSSLQENPGDLPDLRDKIILIGAAAPGLHDLRPTPLGAATPGPEILATALGNLIHQDYLRPLPPSLAPWLGALCLSLLALASRRQINPLLQGTGLALLSLVCVLAAYFLLHYNHLWLPFSTLLTLWLFYAACALHAYLRERQQREYALQLFGRFVDPRVVDSLVAGKALAVAQEGQRQEISVLFSDIRGFTRLSESRAPEEIVRLLNRYFAAQTEIVFTHEGTLDKFIGDAIMAFWGAPVASPQHASQAVAAALALQERLLAFCEELGEDGADFDVGIGVHSGPAVVGFLGAARRLDYTAIGDTVNLASRIEGLTKGVARILVSASTREACLAEDPKRFTFIDHGEFPVKGREKPVRLYEPRSPA